MNAAAQARIREVQRTPATTTLTYDHRDAQSIASVGISRDSQRELQLTLAVLVARTSLTTVIEMLANVALEGSQNREDRATCEAWRHAALQLRDVASRAGAMPDSL